ncbi:MAG: hypothetical protein V2A54_16785 [Bacteroidota bacterium]
MRKLILIILVLAAPLFLRAQTQIPPLNKQIVGYVKTVIGKKVERGECWDLAKVPLDLYKADWDHSFNFGREVDPLKDTIYPGDIIQFTKVTLKYVKEGQTWTEQMPQHTAIIYEVISPGVYKIAHQNTGYTGKKVGVSDLKLEDVSKGKIVFFRPFYKAN